MRTLVLILAAGPIGDEHYSWRSETPRHLLPIAGEPHIRRDLRLIRRFGHDAVVITDAPHIKAVVKNVFEPAEDRLLWDTMLSTRDLWDGHDRVVFVQGDQLLYEDFLAGVFASEGSCSWEADHGPPAVIFAREDYGKCEAGLRHLKSIHVPPQDCMKRIRGFVPPTHRYDDKSLYDWDNVKIWNRALEEQPWISEKPKPVLLLLAAGRGKRLGPLSDETPKALLEFGGLSLAERMIDQFLERGIGEVIVTIGFLGDRVEARLGTERAGVPIKYVVNPDYETTPCWKSISLAREFVYERDCYIAAGDQLFSPGLVGKLAESPHLDAMLVDTTLEPRREPSIAALGGEKLIERLAWPLGYGTGRIDFVGDAPYLLKLSRGGAEILFEFADRGDVECVNEVAKRLPLYYVGTGGLPWAHITTEKGLDYARNVAFPEIVAGQK